MAVSTLRMRKNIRKLSETGFFHIFSSDILNKIIQFCGGMFIVRVVSKVEYGIFTYAQNIFMMVMIVSGLGVGDGLMQYGSRDISEKEKRGILRYCILRGGKFNTVLCLIIIIIPYFFKFGIEGSASVLRLMILMPILMFLFDMIQKYLRVNLENKKFSYLNNISTFSLFILSLLGGFFLGSKGIVIGRYISYAVTSCIGVFFLKETFELLKKEDFKFIINETEFKKFSFLTLINNGLSQLLFVLDIFLIGVIIGDSKNLASYKVATLIPFGLQFITRAVITYVYPYFVKNRENKKWVKNNTVKMIIILGIVNLLISIVLFALAPFIIKIIFGKEYMDSLLLFRILTIGFFIMGTFRIPTGNILVMLGKIKFNTYNALTSGVTNIILNIWLISKYGSIGAAISTVGIFIISSILGMYFLFKAIEEIGSDKM